MKVNLNKASTSQDLIKSFLKTNIITQCPNGPAGATQRIRTKGSKGEGQSRRAKPASH